MEIRTVTSRHLVVWRIPKGPRLSGRPPAYSRQRLDNFLALDAPRHVARPPTNRGLVLVSQSWTGFSRC